MAFKPEPRLNTHLIQNRGTIALNLQQSHSLKTKKNCPKSSNKIGLALNLSFKNNLGFEGEWEKYFCGQNFQLLQDLKDN